MKWNCLYIKIPPGDQSVFFIGSSNLSVWPNPNQTIPAMMMMTKANTLAAVKMSCTQVADLTFQQLIAVNKPGKKIKNLR
jgi:hypothetical protein